MPTHLHFQSWYVNCLHQLGTNVMVGQSLFSKRHPRDILVTIHQLSQEVGVLLFHVLSADSNGVCVMCQSEMCRDDIVVL